MATVSEEDERYLKVIRGSVVTFMRECAEAYDREGARLLDVAPQDHEGAKPFFRHATIRTLDIDPRSGADYVADLCQSNGSLLPDESFDLIVCTEVLEHTLDPFAAVAEIRRLLAVGGLVFVTTPFNFRIHGPLPDCWRFTEHGLRALFAAMEIVSLHEVPTDGRDLMPIHYRLIARKREALALESGK